ncbi:zinc-ribbon domain-containing protein [Flagellimonas pacifica]|uniref:Zinc-ribbon family protein n=1 Tax=Flagellimonas pacifica TaxID=1247520 RepID=A0A285N186_9FLAO|nr:zinc-ribbon family protein [Allomuricauda parva]
MKIVGLKLVYLGALKIENFKCSYCENNKAQNIVEFGNCFHIFWIPMFPLGRKTFMECDHCKRTIMKSEFDHELKKSYYENESKLRRPLWHWSGLVFVILIVIYFIFLN